MNTLHGVVSAKIEEPAILIRINQKFRNEMNQQELYEITRGVWKVGENREKARLAFAVFQGVVKEVYQIDSWHPAGTLPYQTRSEVNKSNRWEFEGHLASDDIREKYLNFSVAQYFSKNSQNPITYINCDTNALIKKIMKSQHSKGVGINKEFHSIFNPKDNEYYVGKGQKREVIVFFNDKKFIATYESENAKSGQDNESIRFRKDLLEEFKIISPNLQGHFSIRLGKSINEFIFEFIDDDSKATNSTVSFDTLEIGKKYDRPELATLWGYKSFQAISKGVVTPRGTDFIILFVTKEKQEALTQYNDYIDGDLLFWEGEQGHGTDKRIINAASADEEIHLFYRDIHHSPFVYYGQIYLEEHQINQDRASEFIFRIGTAKQHDDIFKDIENEEKAFDTLSNTERQSLIKSRVGQGIFRQRVIELWGSCSVTGLKALSLLKASHIKPWRDCTNYERLDPCNGLLLTPNLDMLFDVGYITFESDGAIRISKTLHDKDREPLGIKSDFRLRKIPNSLLIYLEYHREKVFLGQVIGQ